MFPTQESSLHKDQAERSSGSTIPDLSRGRPANYPTRTRTRASPGITLAGLRRFVAARSGQRSAEGGDPVRGSLGSARARSSLERGVRAALRPKGWAAHVAQAAHASYAGAA